MSHTACIPDFLAFLKACPTPYHTVQEIRRRLKVCGFDELSESSTWDHQCRRNGNYFVVREASLVCLSLGPTWQPGDPAAIIAAHTDSPSLRLKPRSKDVDHGVFGFAVEPYGNGTWQTWYDRDLSVAGRVLTMDGKERLQQGLFDIDQPICRIPSLARFLAGSDSWPANNKQNHLRPIAGTIPAPALDITTSSLEDGLQLMTMDRRHHASLLDMIAERLEIPVASIYEIEAFLHDSQEPCLGGLHGEFIFAQRLDNLCMCYCALQGLLRSKAHRNGDSTTSTLQVVSFFDHEEIGSRSAQGAQSDFLPSVLRRLSKLPCTTQTQDAYEQMTAKSLLVSADMAHGMHPNFPDKGEPAHSPRLNSGVALKVNANMRYATCLPGFAIIRMLAEKASVPLQLFTVDNNTTCGTTIGPLLSSLLRTQGLDLGLAQWSMHSIRETAGVADVEHAIVLFEAFLSEFAGCP
ncbi:Aspartyl aminopeptidase [Teratosphaeria destructans]|uniref:aspartyl aminopeptidase n=1 Tax=Teratosphaeria destructans TaxID=418781 RepID=A0A9W7SM88_9PEZI|nr:Aspartyl aminopeptidase [Teratosphaeria destructans]